MGTIAENLEGIKTRIAQAADKAGRKPEEITLVAVSKKHEPSEIREAVAAGVTDLGENYVQESVDKFEELGKIARWHFIGHLQTNKVKPTLEIFDLIQSVDRISLAKEIDKRAAAINRTIDVLMEVNIGGEENKTGAGIQDAQQLLETILQLPNLNLKGMMGMAPIVEDPEKARPYFAQLKKMWDELPAQNKIHLSMGMSGDFEAAIQEGSTMVRIGTAIFGPRKY